MSPLYNLHYKEQAKHGTSELPVGLHHLTMTPEQDPFFYLHWHEEFEIFYIHQGAALFTIEHETHLVKKGECVFVNSRQLHSAKPYQGEMCDFSAIVFHPNLFDDVMNRMLFSKYIYPVLSASILFPVHIKDTMPEYKKMLRLITSIIKLPQEELSQNELLLKAKFIELWHEFFSLAKNAEENLSATTYQHERMAPITEYIRRHYAEEIDLKTLAGLISLSEGQFCRVFKEVIGMTPIAYVNRYRILKSCELLVNTNLRIAHISSDVGFNNVSYYNRSFLEHLECTPTQYRKRFWKH